VTVVLARSRGAWVVQRTVATVETVIAVAVIVRRTCMPCTFSSIEILKIVFGHNSQPIVPDFSEISVIGQIGVPAFYRTYFFVFLMQFGLRRAAAFVLCPIHNTFVQRQITRKWYKIEPYLQWQTNSKFAYDLSNDTILMT